MAPPAPPLPPLLLLLLASAHALPIVDPGLFVIMGVKTCRAGSGYCLLGNDCTLDEDFLPDDRGGHCDGLRSAFTPSAHFVCCRYSAEPNTTLAPATVTTEAGDATTEVVAGTTDAGVTLDDATTEGDGDGDGDDGRSTTTEGAEHRATDESSPETTTRNGDFDTSTPRDILDTEEDEQREDDAEEDNKTDVKNSMKKTRIETEEEQTSSIEEQTSEMTETTTENLSQSSEYPSTVRTDSINSTSHELEHTSQKTEDTKNHDENKGTENSEDSDAEENKNSLYSFSNNGIMMHDILKLITEGEWQVSVKNNEVADENSEDGTTKLMEEITTKSDNSDSPNTTISSEEHENEEVTESEDVTKISNRESPEENSSHSTTSKHPTTERHEPEVSSTVHFTSIGSTTSTPNYSKDDHTHSLNIVTTLEKEVIVRDREEQENPTSDVPVPSTDSGVDWTGTTSTGLNKTSLPEAEQTRGLCLGDALHEGDCWILRFVDTRFDSFLCHGAMIAHDLVLTSAECAVSLYQAGTSNVEAYGSASKPPMGVISIAVHEEFLPGAADAGRHDVGLIRVTPRNACLVCVAPPSLKLTAEDCYTFAGLSHGDGEVQKLQCEKVSVLEHQEHRSVRCTIPRKFQVHSGAPLVCGNAVAGVAYHSEGDPVFTPAAQLLPWVRWNVDKFYV